jgi:glycosyltransferase involved in cell wall biosynthesis
MKKENLEKRSESVRVLYVVGNIDPISTALEVSRYMGGAEAQILVASFYETEYQTQNLPLPLVQINSTGRFDLSGAWRLFRHVVEYNPDVIHVHHTVSAFWAALFGRLIGAKIIYSEHSNPKFHTPIQHYAKSIARVLSDLVLCNSRTTYKGIPSYQKNFLRNEYRIVYNGVDKNRIERGASISPPFEIEEKSDRITVGTVGRLIDEKNHERLLQAFSRVLKRFEGAIRLVIIGGGEKLSVLKKEVDRLGIAGQVIITGEVEREKVYAALHSFDVFVMPSLSEGFCNAAVEAMAAGLPLLCSDIPTLREVVGDVAKYADPRDSSSMSKALVELLREGSKGWEKRGRKARQRAVERYSIERTAQEYLQAYLEV